MISPGNPGSCLIEMVKPGGDPRDYDHPEGHSVALIELCMNPLDDENGRNFSNKNCHGVEFEKVIKKNLLCGVIFNLGHPIKLELCHNKIGLELTDMLFKSASATFRLTQEEERLAKDLIQAHLDLHQIHYALITLAKLISANLWSVTTRHYRVVTIYSVDTEKGIVLSSKSSFI